MRGENNHAEKKRNRDPEILSEDLQSSKRKLKQLSKLLGSIFDAVLIRNFFLF